MWWQAAFAAGVFGLVVAQAPTPAGASADIRDATGALLATAAFREGSGEVLVTLTFPRQGTLSGPHAIHINDTGRCDQPDFATSGSLFNPFNKQHGRNNPEGAEVGDLPNLNFSTGLTSYNANAIGATLSAGPGSLVSPSRSILIYAGADDQQTPPDGNPGAPIACGVIVAALSAAPASPAAVAQAAPSTVSQVVPRPGVSPVTVAKPVAASASALPSPSPIVAAAPTPILILPTPVPLAATTQASQAASSGPSLVNIGVIAVLGLALIGAGVLLRRGSAETKQQNG